MACVLMFFFELWRLILLIRDSHPASVIPTATLFKAFLVGWRFDFVIASYVTFPLYIIGIIPFLEVSRQRLVRILNFGILVAVWMVICILYLVDLEFFPFFNARLNGDALTWQDTPGMVVSMIWETYPVIWYLLLGGVVLAAFIWVMRWFQRQLLVERETSPIWVNLLFLPLVFAILVLGARGRLEEHSPIRTGLAYFSEYDYANQLALNPVFTFWRDAVYDARDKDQLEKMIAGINCPDGEMITRRLLGVPDSLNAVNGSKIYRPVRFAPSGDDPPNVILIMMESFGNTGIGALDNRFPWSLSPGFDSLTEDGILFTNFYSTGVHTYAGLFSTLLGYPHQFTELIMKQVPGQVYFQSTASILRDYGYQTHFFLTHDPHFDNMQGFAMSNGIMRTYSSLDYDPSLRISTWGVPDHVMFDRAVEVLRDNYPERFFALLLTTSHHGPWIVPDAPFERVPSGVEHEKPLNAFRYSDWALTRFVRQIQRDTLFANTVILITADNGSPYERRLELDLTEVTIPLLILDTDGRLPEGERNPRLGSQLDIPATIMGLTRLDYDNYSFGHDLLDTTSDITDYAHFSSWYKIGYIEDDYYLIHRMRGGPKSLYRMDDCSVNLADSLPALVEEYETKAKAIFKTAYYNMKRPFSQTPTAIVKNR